MARSSTSYAKGQSGNLRGRPKADFDLRDFARGFGRPAILSLVQLAGLTDIPPATNDAVRVAAIRELLDRGYGKATAILAGDDAQPLRVDFRWADATTNTLPGDEAPPPLLEAEAAGDGDEAGGAVVVQWAAAD